MAFQRAVKRESKLRLALAGPAGSGKTWTSLALATELANGGLVAVIDTERGSASKYADRFIFDVMELSSFDPDHYTAAIKEAVAAGYAVIVVDSLTHAWNGKDGLLEQVERIAKLRHGGNTFKAWGDTEIRRKESALIEALTGSPLHVIATMRTKTEYVVEQNERGKAQPRKVGTAPIQRDGTEYEFDVFGELTPDNDLIVQKTRCPALTGQVITKPGKPMADVLKTWLAGAAPEPASDPHIVPSHVGANRTDGRKVAPNAAPKPMPERTLKTAVDQLKIRMNALGLTIEQNEDIVLDAIGKLRFSTLKEVDAVNAKLDLIERDRRNQQDAAARVPENALMPKHAPEDDEPDDVSADLAAEELPA